MLRFHALAPLCVALLGCGPEAAADPLSHGVQQALPTMHEGVKNVTSWKDSAPEALRMRMCDEEGGQWVELLEISPCDAGTATVMLDGVPSLQACGEDHRGGEGKKQCVHHDADGAVYFNDGPSVPPAMLTLSGWLDESLDQMHYNELFWRAGVNHDHCYHGNPSSYGYSKQDCDERFIEDLLTVCLYHEEADTLHWFKPTICRTYASLMFGMVRRHGNESYSTYNLRAVYPEPRPVYQQLGFSQNPITDGMKDEVEAMLLKFNIIDESEENPDHS